VIKVERTAGRSFGRKAFAFNRGVAELGSLEFDFLGNLDADITFAPDYYERVLAAFSADPRLGLSGGTVLSKLDRTFTMEDNTEDSVAGAVQLFRKECFAQIGGGYLALEFGGIDAAAEVMARMKGWTVRKLLDNRVYEGRTTGTADRGVVSSRFRSGQRLHSLGYGAGFHLLRCGYRIKDHPAVIGSIAEFVGYMSAALCRKPVLLPAETVSFWRKERRHKMAQKIAFLLPGLAKFVEQPKTHRRDASSGHADILGLPAAPSPSSIEETEKPHGNPKIIARP
jgi:hypothetical protein